MDLLQLSLFSMHMLVHVLACAVIVLTCRMDPTRPACRSLKLHKSHLPQYFAAGISQYVKWASVPTFRSFYTDATIKGWFKDYISTLVTRRNTKNGIVYRDDPTIFGWELANEPSNWGDESGTILTVWRVL